MDDAAGKAERAVRRAAASLDTEASDLRLVARTAAEGDRVTLLAAADWLEANAALMLRTVQVCSGERG
jgi:hypothetical protein